MPKIADTLLQVRQQVRSQAKTVREDLLKSDFKSLLTKIAAEQAQSGLHIHQVVLTIAWENDSPVVDGVDILFAEI